MLESLTELIANYQDNKWALIIFTALVTFIMTKVIPTLWSWLKNLCLFVGRKAGGRFAFREFHKRYLDWIITEHSELKLTGIVTSDDAKKPKLEQVFLSLQIGKDKNQGIVPEDTTEIFRVFGRLPTWQELKEIVVSQRHLAKMNQSSAKVEIDESLNQLNKYVIKRRKNLLFNKFRGKRKKEIGEKENDKNLEKWIIRNAVLIGPLLGNFQLKIILQNYNYVALLGAPGAGKTTLLQYLALTYGREKAKDPKVKNKGVLKKRLGLKKWRLPIFVRLSSIAGMLVEYQTKEKDPSIVDILHRILPPDLQSDKIAIKYFVEQLKRGNCLLLFDGLDEVPTEEEFLSVVKAINSLCVTYKQNQFVITSRIAGWRSGVNSEFELFYVNDLNSAQINSFIDTWYLAVEQNAIVGRIKDESQAEKSARFRRSNQKAADLKSTLKNNIGIQRLATNPMLLSIIAVVHRSLATLPKERSKLYAQCCKILLEQWDISRGIRVDDTKLKLEQKEAIMRRLAFAFHTGEIGDKGGGREAKRGEVEAVIGSMLPNLGRSVDDAKHLLQILISRSGVIVERQRDTLAFAHHTFQEYFAAQYLAIEEQSASRNFLLKDENILSDWWREVILLYSGLVPDSSDFIKSIFEGNSSDLCRKQLRLAALCLGESVELRNFDLRKNLTFEVLKIRATNKSISLNSNFLTDIHEYLLQWANTQQWYSSAALTRVKTSESDNEVKSEISNALNDEQSIIRRAALDALPYYSIFDGFITDSAFRSLNDKDDSVRAASINVLRRHFAKATNKDDILINLFIILSDKNPSLIFAAGTAIIDIKDEILLSPPILAAFDGLLKRKNGTEKVERDVYVALLNKMEAADLWIYIDSLSYLPDGHFMYIVRQLTTLNKDVISEKLIERIKSIINGAEDKTVKYLQDFKNDVLSHVDILTCLFSSIEEQSKAGKQKILKVIITEASRSKVEFIEGKILEFLYAPGNTLRCLGLQALVNLKEFDFEKTDEIIWDYSKSKSATVREEAAKALVVFRSTTLDVKAVRTLSGLLSDKNDRVKKAAIRSLGGFKTFSREPEIYRDVLNVSYTLSIDLRIEVIKLFAAVDLSFEINQKIGLLYEKELVELESPQNSSQSFFKRKYFEAHLEDYFIISRLFDAVTSFAIHTNSSLILQRVFAIIISNQKLIELLDIERQGGFFYSDILEFEHYENNKMHDLQFDENIYYYLDSTSFLSDEMRDANRIFIDKAFRLPFLRNRRKYGDLNSITPNYFSRTFSKIAEAMPSEEITLLVVKAFKGAKTSTLIILLRLLLQLKEKLDLRVFEKNIIESLDHKDSQIRDHALRLYSEIHPMGYHKELFDACIKKLSDDSGQVREKAWKIIEKRL